ncbi:SMI1/KNR4 family protein [Roseivirga sp.]|uniref:SMI1/KNR4 family protein n=1 Tax=Roseivirga sp. TaxID=1964215 RepID=UPI002B271A4C|nr:SMI1/KNR4 family protein [Roseivirga sp.]
MLNFFDQEQQLTNQQIGQIEKELSFKFPQEFRSHLLNYNGGRCDPNVFKFQENGKPAYSSIDWFLSVYDGEYDNFKKYYTIYKIDEKRLPSNIVPIAHDPGGNLICLEIDTGRVFFWNHEREVDYSISSDTDYSNLYLVANNFNEFLEGLA